MPIHLKSHRFQQGYSSETKWFFTENSGLVSRKTARECPMWYFLYGLGLWGIVPGVKKGVLPLKRPSEPSLCKFLWPLSADISPESIHPVDVLIFCFSQKRLPRVSQPLRLISSIRTRWHFKLLCSQQQAQSGMQLISPPDSYKDFSRRETILCKSETLQLLVLNTWRLQSPRSWREYWTPGCHRDLSTAYLNSCLGQSMTNLTKSECPIILYLLLHYKFYFQFKSRYQIEAQYSIAFPFK